MNTTWRTRTVAVLAVAALAGGGLWGFNAAQAADPSPAPAPSAATRVADETLVKNARYMREEERMARDLYQAFADAHGSDTAFARIAKAEQRHFDAIGRILTRYGIEDLSAGKEAGKYAEPKLQKEYDRLLAQGKESLAKAYQAGIEVEKADIADLDDVIKQTTAPDAKRVFENLRNGSLHHLDAFTALADGKTPEGRNGFGMGRGQGPGKGQGQGWRHGGGFSDDDARPRGRGMGPMDPADRPADCPRR